MVINKERSRCDFYVCIGAEGHEQEFLKYLLLSGKLKNVLKEMIRGIVLKKGHHSKWGVPNICGHELTIRKFEVKTKKEIMELMNELAGSWWNLS
ncbi:MAG: hypothetical protein CM15mV83_130 [uncultured marine virus]|nr:MAG: hypothetical protein CM15mV83_130 [uncultured marine virus]